MNPDIIHALETTAIVVAGIEDAESAENADALRVLLERWTCVGAGSAEAGQPAAPPNGGHQ
jgi:hypothetical protein